MHWIPNALVMILLLAEIELARAVEFEKLGSAIMKVIGSKTAQKLQIDLAGESIAIFLNPSENKNIAIQQSGVYPPNCTHTWVIGLAAQTCRIGEIRVIEMSCPHAFPTRQASFLEQFIGASPANLKELDKNIVRVAKATGSADLTLAAVKKSVDACSKWKKGR